MREMVRFCSLLREHRPEVVVYSFSSIVKPYPWLARALGVDRVFYNDHSSDRSGPPRMRRLLAERAAGLPLHGVIGVSRYVRERAIERGWAAPDRVHAVYNGVDLDAIKGAAESARAFRERYRIPEGRRIVSQTSWIVPYKGVDKLVRAAPQVLAQLPDVHFVIVGEGEQRPELERLAAELGIADHVTWTGVVQRPVEEGVFAASDVCCQLSRWKEAFGLTIAEAMSFGVPVVATRVGAIPELVADGENGFLVGPDEVEGVARAITALLSDAELRERLGRAARKRAEEMFDLRRTVARYLEILGVTAGEGSSARPPAHVPPAGSVAHP
jgi:glycosyltransferase involved in cell wall biosynthesis